MKKILRKWNEMPITAKASIAYAICGVFQRCLGFITLPLFTNLLTTEQYGQTTVYSSWSSLLAILLTLQLPYGSFSTAMVKYDKKRDEYIASAEGICLLLAVTFLIVYLPKAQTWNMLFELPTWAVVVMTLEIVANSGIAFWSGKKRFEFKYKEVIAFTFVLAVVSVLIQYLFVINSSEKGYARLLASALVNIFFGGIVFAKSALKGKRLVDKEFWNYAFGFNVPLLAYYLSQMIFNTSDRIMISHIVGTGKAAVYGVAYNLAVLLSFVLNAIYNSYIPWIYNKIKEGRQKENEQVAVGISVFMASLLLGIIWFSPEIIHVMTNDEYIDAIWIVPPVAMSVLLLFYSQLSISFEFYYEKKGLLVRASIGAAIMNIVLNMIFIPRIGYYAAGYTTLISYIFFAWSNYRAMKKILNEKKISDQGFDMRKLVLIFICFMSFGFCGMALYDYLIIRIVGILIPLIFLYINRTRLLMLWNGIRKQT